MTTTAPCVAAAAGADVEHIAFTAMGTNVAAVVHGGPVGLAGRVRRRITELEARWSRFRSDSEVTALNQAGGRELAVSADTIVLLQRAITGWELTGGAFDPTILASVVALGYDRSFTELAAGPMASVAAGHLRTVAAPGCGGISLDAERATVRLPAGCGIDPGGIGKGLAADLVVDEARRAGAAGILVNIGGDVRVSGAAPTPGGWPIGIAHPQLPDTLLDVVVIEDGAVVTSTPLERRWRQGDRLVNHLVDPLSGEPAAIGLASVTAIAAEGWYAEVATKAAAVAGAAGAAAALERLGVAGLVVTADGTVIRVGC